MVTGLKNAIEKVLNRVVSCLNNQAGSILLLTMCLLITKVSLKAYACYQKLHNCPRAKHPHACKQSVP